MSERERDDFDHDYSVAPGPDKLMESLPRSSLYSPEGQAEQVGAMARGLLRQRSNFGFRRWFIPVAVTLLAVVIGVGIIAVAYFGLAS